MSRRSFSASLLLTAAILLGGNTPFQPRVHAQEPDSVKITTVDGVRLNAFFYRSPKKSVGTVIMLHPIGIGESCKKEGWKDLAETLQKNNYSVLMFDFRGHGDSTTVDPELFWSHPLNRIVKKSSKEGDDVNIKDYIAPERAIQYYPVLVNDIAAVKAYLDKRHDMAECNTSNTIVIGAESGATLGAIWINSEWNRFKMIPPENPLFMKPTFEKRAEGNDIVAAVFLNIHDKLGKRLIPLKMTLAKACKMQGMPTAFICGDQDTESVKMNKPLVEALTNKKSKKGDYIGLVRVKDTKLAGVKLLGKGLDTKEGIVSYLDKVLSDRSNEWEGRDFGQSSYVWRDPLAGYVPCKTKIDKTFKYDPYTKFISQ